MTYPTIVHPASFSRADSDDGKYSLWNVAWVAHALITDPAHVFDANIFYPHRGTLAYSEANLVAGALAVPAYALTRDPLVAHNVVVFAVLVLAFLTTWSLARRLTGSSAAGIFAGTAYAFCAYVSAHTAHIQLLMVFVVPTALLALHGFADRPGPGRAVALGLALALAGLSSGYYGIFTGLTIGWGAILLAPRDSLWRYWLGLLLAALVAGAVVAPFFRPYLELRRDSGFKAAPDLIDARGYSADLLAYLRADSVIDHALLDPVRGALLRASGAPLSADEGEVLFPGAAACALAIVGVAGLLWRKGPAPDASRTARRCLIFYATLTVLAAWVSFGPRAGLYTIVAKAIPFMSFLRAPARAGVFVDFGVAVLAAYGLARLLERQARAWLAPLVIVVAAAEAKTTWPLVPSVEVAEAYHRLASLPRGGVLALHFPYRSGDLHRHAAHMYWSMWNWQPLVNGYSDYIPEDFRQMAVPINFFPDPASLELARAHQVRYVLVDLDSYGPGDGERQLARFAPYRDSIIPLVETGRVRLFEIVKWP